MLEDTNSLGAAHIDLKAIPFCYNIWTMCLWLWHSLCALNFMIKNVFHLNYKTTSAFCYVSTRSIHIKKLQIACYKNLYKCHFNFS